MHPCPLPLETGTAENQVGVGLGEAGCRGCEGFLGGLGGEEGFEGRAEEETGGFSGEIWGP